MYCLMNLTRLEHDIQEEDFELGLIKKDFLPNQEQGNNSQEGLVTGPDSSTGQEASEQTGSAEPCLQQRTTENPESGARTGTEIGPITVSEPGSPHSQDEDRPILIT